MREEILKELKQISHPEKTGIQVRILNTAYPLLGHYVGDVRKIAKRYSGDLVILEKLEKEYYEEILLRGFILAYNKTSILEKFDLILDYLNLVDSWALIDSFCSTFKVKEKERLELFEFLKECLNSNKEFIQRFALIMFLSHYIKYKEGKLLHRPKRLELDDLEKSQESTWLGPILNEINKPYSTYYAQMGVAWLLAETFLFFPKEIIDFLKNNNLDDQSLNFTIDKIKQSRQPSEEVKKYLEKYKRKLKKFQN